MQNQVQVFTNAEFGTIEVLTIKGKPYFPAVECAAVLGYSKPHNAISRHCRDSLKRGVIDTLGRKQEKLFIPEGDVYRLIIRSKLPAAVRFEAFVCDEILPSIRQHGAYIAPETLERMREDATFTEELLERLSAEYAKNNALMDRLDVLQPKAQYCDIILQCDRAVPTTLIAKDYGMTAQAFNKLLHDLKIQYRIGGVWFLYKDHADKGYTVTKTYYVGRKQVSIHTAWTQRGRKFVYDALAWYGILPVVERLEEVA
jgi:prophage antirepressor-like protein